ncbi:12018_t:CDS:2 [Funneliformis geosporum]|nr:12018_t:CDS:2 [Funneliformis geosporum]
MSTHHEDPPLSNIKKGKRKAQYCDLEGQDDVICDYEQYEASIVSEQIVIPSSSQHLDLVARHNTEEKKFKKASE